jgi:hypothetical protein
VLDRDLPAAADALGGRLTYHVGQKTHMLTYEIPSPDLAAERSINWVWYRNLDPTVEDLARHLEDGDLLVDYSGGTGILLDRLNLRIFDRQVGTLIVDSSPKFRVALDKFGDEERVAFRLLRCSRRRSSSISSRSRRTGAAGPKPTPSRPRTRSTCRPAGDLAPGLRCCGRVGACSCSRNIQPPGPARMILDETVGDRGRDRTGPNDPRYGLPPAADDEPRMAHVGIRPGLPAIRPLDHYLRCLRGRLTVGAVTARSSRPSRALVRSERLPRGRAGLAGRLRQGGW